jgi:hypothetical protein
MRRLIPTLVLLIVCIGGYWYAASHNFFREQTDTVKTLVASVKTDDVQSVSLQMADGAPTELQRAADGKAWTMTKPTALPVDDNSVDGWIQSYNALTFEAKVEDNADLAKYGLDKPKQVYKLTMKNGPVHTVSVGSPLAIQGYSYVSVDDAKTVYQVSDQTLQGIGKAPVDFQVKGPVKFDYDKVVSLAIKWKDQAWTLTKTDKDKPAADASWKLGSKDLKGSDATPILDAFLFVETQVEAKPASAINMTPPDFTADVTQTDTTVKYVGKIDGDNVWLLRQGDSWAYAIPAQSLQDLADKGKQ